MRHTADQTACLLAVILVRSEQNRARVSAKTIKLLAKRRALRSAFLSELKEAMLEYDWALCEIASGGFGAIRSKTLEAAKTVTARNFLDDDERRSLHQGKVDFADLEDEAAPEETQPGEDE